MKKNKTFKTYEEQIEILNSKGLITDSNSLGILKRNNYYFLINRYKDLFIVPNSKPNRFNEGTHFNEIVSIYDFDRELRMILLKYIITIENTLKSIISHEFSKKYSHEYMNINSFETLNNDKVRAREIKGLFNTIYRTIKKGIKYNNYVKYYHNNYNSIPLWVIINDLRLGNVIGFYHCMHKEDQEMVSKEFGISSDELYKYLRVLHYFRNLSAHNQRTFDEKSKEFITRCEIHEKLCLDKEEGLNDIMSVLITCSKLLEKKDFVMLASELMFALNLLDENVNTIDMESIYKKMGINENWIILSEKA